MDQQNPESQPDPNVQTLFPPRPASVRRRNGRVARLPSKFRDIVNRAIHEGLTYDEIMEILHTHGHNLTTQNLSNWKKGGYQDWLLHQDWLEQMRVRQDFALDLVRNNETSTLHEASLQIAAGQICEILANFSAAPLSAALKNDLTNYTRLLNALARLSHHGLKCERYRADQLEKKEFSKQFWAELKAQTKAKSQSQSQSEPQLAPPAVDQKSPSPNNDDNDGTSSRTLSA